MSTLKSLVNVSHVGLLFQQESSSNGVTSYAAYFVTAALFLFLAYSWRDQYPNLPRLNSKKATEFTWRGRLLDYMERSRTLLEQGRRQFGGQPYNLFTDLGDTVIVPSKYADELRSHRALEFGNAAADFTHRYIPGLAPFKNEPGFSTLVQNNLTKALVNLTAPISAEASKALRDVFTDSKEWTPVTPEDIMLVVSRMSSRVFMGEELWAFFNVLTQWPWSLRPWVHWFMPRFTAIRQQLALCRQVLQPHINHRLAVKEAAAAQGKPNPYNDSIEWFSREIRSKYDPTNVQLSLTLVAIHTTTDLLTQTMMDIAKHPEILGSLREETLHVLRNNGLNKLAFQKLRLMDACLKESQRLRPIMLAYYRRKAVDDVTLRDGFTIKKGTIVAMDGREVMLKEVNYPEPLHWNPYRFLQMRETGEENKAHLVSASDKHVGFGHGIHACPGRFFAANELKIAMAHILLKYDWKLADDASDLPVAVGGSTYMLPYGVKLLVARRQEELDLDALEF
ncbi:cytochrome P450 [Colletotrichum somersetense]|nr:cytochrome P450 [Colletotrichum somersetense]